MTDEPEPPPRPTTKATAAVWSPDGDGSESKEYKPVKFELPPEKTQVFPQNPPPPCDKQTKTSQDAKEQAENVSQSTTYSSSTDSIITVKSADKAAGVVGGKTSPLPRVQSPTVTLLQKARAGEIPKGPDYISPKSSTEKLEMSTSTAAKTLPAKFV